MSANKLFFGVCLLFFLILLLAGSLAQEFGQWLTATLF